MKDEQSKFLFVLFLFSYGFFERELTKNLDKSGNRKAYLKSLRKAITSDTALARVAIADATGNLIMNTRMMTDSAMRGEAIASRADFDYLVENASGEEIAALTETFGIDDWGRITVDEFNAKMTELGENGTLKSAAEQIERKRKAKEAEASPAKALPHRLSPKLSDGVHHYTTESGENIALIREENTYYVYDYATGNISKAMTVQEVNKRLRTHYTSVMQTTSESKIAAAMPLAEATADLSAETKTAADSTEVESAADSVTENEEYNNAVDAELLDFIDSVNSMKNKNLLAKRKHYIGKVSESHSQLVSEIIARELNQDIDVSGYTIQIDGSAIQHIEIKHGVNGISDKSMSQKEDVARIGWAANNAESGHIARTKNGTIDYSTKYKNRDGSLAPKIILEKSVGNNKLIVAECVPDSDAKKIHIVSARIIKGDNGQVLNIESKDSPQPTSKTLLDYNVTYNGDNTITTNSISDISEKINPSDKNFSEKVSKVTETKNAADSTEVESAAETKSKNGESIRNAIFKTEDNKPFVEIEEDILDGIAETDWIKTVKQNLSSKFPNGIKLRSDTIKINQNSRREMTFSKYMQWLLKNSPQIFSDKLRATNNVDEILKATTDWVGEALNHPRNDNVREFARGNVLIRVGQNDYSAEVVVGTMSDNSLVMYDIVNISPTTIIKKETRNAITSDPSRGAGRKTKRISNNSISDSSEKINPSDKNSSEKVSSYEKLKAQNAEIAKFAEEKIKDYKKLSEPSRRAVRAVIRQGRAHGLSDADIITIASVSAHSGAKIKFSKADCKRTNKKGETFYVDGFYDGDSDTITVNPEKTRTTDKLLCHELLHDITMHLGGTKKGFKLYKKLVKQAFNNMSEEQQKGIVEKYQEIGETRESVLSEEILAHYGEAFANKSFFEAMLKERESLGKRILNFFKSAITDYQGDERLSRSAVKFHKAFKKLFDEYSRANQNTNAYETNLRLSGGEKRNALCEFEDGQRFVSIETDQALFDGLSIKEQTDLATKIIKNRFQGKVIGIENRVFVNGVTANEYSHPSKHIEEDIYTAKMRASTELDNLMDAGFNFRNAADGQDGHNHFGVVGGFDYFDVIFNVADEYYQGVINIENNKRGKRLKDITKIENTTKDVTSRYGNNPSYAFLRDASMISISEKTEKSNTFSENFAENNSNKRNALSADFDTAKGSISTEASRETESKLKKLKTWVNKSTPSAMLATQIQFTNQQAGIEAAGRALGIKGIESEVQAVRASKGQVQEMLGGKQWSLMGDEYVMEGDGFFDIIEPMKAKGEEYWNDYQLFLFHRHNIDRMSLEERSIAKNEAKKQELSELEKKLKEIKSQLDTLKAELKALKLKKDRQSTLEREKLKDIEQGLLAEKNALEKNVNKLSRDIESFKPEENKAVFGKEENGETVAITADESREIVEEYLKLHPEFEAESEKLYKYLDNLQKMRLDSGLIDETLYKALKEKYPHYVPTYREETNQGTSGISGKYSLSVKKTIGRAKGGFEKLMSLDKAIPLMTEQVVTAGNVNRLGNILYDAALSKNNNDFIGELTRESTNLEDFTSDDNKTATERTNQISIYRNGEKITLSVTKEVFAGFDAFNVKPDFASAPIKFLAGSNKIFKELVTSLNPFFLVRNVIRDFQDAGINTKYFKTFFKNYCRAIYHLSHNTKQAQLYRAMGGLSSSVFESGKGYVAKQSKMGFAVSNNKLKAIFSKMQNLNMFVEQIPRFAEFLSSIEAGNSPKQAILDAADVTTNFGRTGKITKSLNSTIIPFLNPAIQGLSKLTRNVREAFTSVRAFSFFAVRLALIGVIPQIFNQLMYEDDEEYEELKDTDKENNYLFKVGELFIKIPKGRVVSVIAGAVNRTRQEIEGKDADWKDYFDNVVSQVTPVENFARPVWAPVQDVLNNRTWYGSEIEGQQFENVREEDRYDESTSSWAIALGKVFNYSPKKIHYLIDQYSGVIGDFILPFTTQKAENSLIKGNFSIDPTTSNSLSDDFYKLYEEAQYSKTDGDVTAKYQLKHLNSVKKAVSEMYDEKTKIQQSSLSDAEKLQQTRVIQALINEAYRNAIDGYESYTQAITSTQGIFDEETEEKLRYTEITRIVYGAEKALKDYNSDVYEKCRTLNSAGISYDTLYTYYFATKGITSDTDRRGNAVNGSRRKKIVSAINSLNASREQKLLLIASKGYSLQDGDVRGWSAETAKKRLLRYILYNKNLSRDEKARLAEACGFTVKNGRILTRSAS